MELHPEYTLEIKMHLDWQSIPRIVIHFDRLQDAFDKFLSIRVHQFITGFGAKPYEKINVSEASICRGQQKELLISSGVVPETFGENLGLPPGFYFRFPDSVSEFEKTSGINFSDFKGYHPDSGVLMAATRNNGGLYLFRKLIAYENMLVAASKRIENSRQYGVSHQHYHFDAKGDYLGSLQPVPFREDYLFDNADRALCKLLQTGFNALDEQVAWEKDLRSWISRAVLYRNRDGFGLDFRETARLHSARKHGLRIGMEIFSGTGIYLELTHLASREEFNYPFSSLEKQIGGRDIFLVGRYNDSLNETEKVPGLLLPFEKIKSRITQAGAKRTKAKKAKEKIIQKRSRKI